MKKVFTGALIVLLAFLTFAFTDTVGTIMYSAAKTFSLGQADCKEWSKENPIIVCAESPFFLHGRAGTMFGNVFITSDKMENLSETVIEHETVHYKQQQQYGLLFIPLYFMEGITNPCKNTFEEEASFRLSGYSECYGEEHFLK